MSRQASPASASAWRIAIAPISMPVTPAKRPNGCNPTPTIATSTAMLLYSPRCRRGSGHGPEREGDDLVALLVAAERHQHELHVHADPQPLRLRETRLDLQLVRKLHVADAVRNEGVARRSGIRRRRRRKVLGRP